MEKDDRQNGTPEQAKGSREPQRASRPAPGKVTRTARLSAGRAPTVQRTQVATDGGGAARARTAWAQTMEPWMDAAHRGLTALAEHGHETAQMRGATDPPAERVHDLAARGISGASSALPHGSDPGTTPGGIVQREDDPVSATECVAELSEAQRNFLAGQGIDPAGLDPAAARRLARLLDTAEQVHRALEAGDFSAVSAGPDVAVTANRTISDAGAEISVMIVAEGSSLLISQRFDLTTGTLTRQFAYQDAGGDRMEAQSTSAPQILGRVPIERQALEAPELPEIRIASPEGGLMPESPSSSSDEALDDFADLLPPEDDAAGSSEGVGSFLEGAILGDVGDNDSWSAIAGQTVIGFVPIAGQIADVRDLLASFRGVTEGRDGAWLNIAIAGVAFIPGLDFLKGGTRVGRRALREAADESITEVSEASLKRMRRVSSRQAVEAARRRLRALAAGRIELMQRLTELMENPALHKRTRDFVKDARNAIRDHMSPQDLSGALRDRLGIPVRRSGSGKAFNHHHEVDGALVSIESARKVLLGELQRLEPGSDAFRLVSRELDAMAEMQRRVQEFLETR